MTRCDEGEFLGRVPGILDGWVKALPAGRAVDVRGAAGQEHP